VQAIINCGGKKKETSIGSILEHQNSTVSSTSDKQRKLKLMDDKPKRARIVPVKAAIQKNTNSSLFSNEQVALWY
jgi:transcription termination factor Rho